MIDSLDVEDLLLNKLEKLGIPIIIFDDEKRKNILNKGFIIDWTVLSDLKNYFMPRKKNVTYFLGSRYASLRHEFSSSNRIEIKKEIKNIFISFGGSDVRNLSPKILNFLRENYPLLKKNIVIGPGFNNIDEIKDNIDDNTNLFFNLNSLEMINCMKNCDIAISAGGQTLYELARISLPTIAILLVENAKEDTLGWSEVGFVDYIGEYNCSNLFSNLASSMKDIQSFKKRLQMYSSVENHITFQNENILVKNIVEVLHDTF